MSKRMRVRQPGPKKKKEPDGLPLVVLISIGALTLLGYFAGVVVFAAGPHPAHWILALLGGLLGWMLGSLYYRVRGDII